MISGHPARAAVVFTLGVAGLSGCTSASPTVEAIVSDLAQVREGDDLWQGDAESCLSGSADPDDPDVAGALAVAMPEDSFWELISVLNGSNGEDDFARLSSTLEQKTVDELVAFDARLALTLYALDDECHLVAFRDSERWDGGWVNGDAFLYARADTVSAGRETWERAVRDGGLPAGETEPMYGESLLYATLDASVALGMEELELWEIERDRFSLSYESGSNASGWQDGDAGFILSTEEIGG